MTSDNPIPRALLTEAQAAELLGVKAQTLSVWRCTGRWNLPYVKVGTAVRYRPSDLEAWITARTVSNTAQADALEDAE